MHQVCLAKNNAQEHFTFELIIKSHDTPTRSTFDARQNFVSRHICRDSSGSDTRLKVLMNSKLHPGIVDLELGQEL